MCHTHKYKSADDNVKHRIARNEYQDPLCVCCQPDVVLANEKLEEKKKMFESVYHKYFCLYKNHILLLLHQAKPHISSKTLRIE